jgi:hypothetical protein
MSRALLSRLARLETRATAAERDRFRIGYLTTLPPDYSGERHVVILSRLRTDDGMEVCACEERPGPAPAGAEISDCQVYFGEIDRNL